MQTREPSYVVTAISVITVVRNGERFLEQAIANVAQQTATPLEHLIIDGQSRDRTPEIARHLPGIRYVMQPDTGLASARNLGVRLARGNFIAFLDHDDLWHPDKLRLQLDCMERYPDLQYTTTGMSEFRTKLGANMTRAGTGLSHAIREGCTPSATIVRRECFETVGWFDAECGVGCDSDWFARARELAVPHATVPQVLLYKRRHDHNLSRDVAENRRHVFALVRRSLGRRRDQELS